MYVTNQQEQSSTTLDFLQLNEIPYLKIPVTSASSQLTMPTLKILGYLLYHAPKYGATELQITANTGCKYSVIQKAVTTGFVKKLGKRKNYVYGIPDDKADWVKDAYWMSFRLDKLTEAESWTYCRLLAYFEWADLDIKEMTIGYIQKVVSLSRPQIYRSLHKLVDLGYVKYDFQTHRMKLNSVSKGRDNENLSQPLENLSQPLETLSQPLETLSQPNVHNKQIINCMRHIPKNIPLESALVLPQTKTATPSDVAALRQPDKADALQATEPTTVTSTRTNPITGVASTANYQIRPPRPATDLPAHQPVIEMSQTEYLNQYIKNRVFPKMVELGYTPAQITEYMNVVVRECKNNYDYLEVSSKSSVEHLELYLVHGDHDKALLTVQLMERNRELKKDKFSTLKGIAYNKLKDMKLEEVGQSRWKESPETISS